VPLQPSAIGGGGLATTNAGRGARVAPWWWWWWLRPQWAAVGEFPRVHGEVTDGAPSHSWRLGAVVCGAFPRPLGARCTPVFLVVMALTMLSVLERV